MKTLKAIKIIWFFEILLTILSCSNDDNRLTKEQEAQQLSEMFAEVEALASSESCDDSSEWTYTSYGSKACGGPIGYIAYSTNIDTELFLQKIEEHRTAQQAFNENGVSLVIAPFHKNLMLLFVKMEIQFWNFKYYKNNKRNVIEYIV